MKYGILFSGQGAQRPGMGVDLLSDSLFSKTIAAASAASQLDIPKIMRDEHDELKQTRYVQPALAAVSYGIYQMLRRDLPDLPVGGMAGLSLGEYPALMASRSMDFAAGMALLADRAEYMQADADKTASTLAAVLNPAADRVEQLCQRYQDHGQPVYVANYNSPRQLVIGGPVANVRKAAAEIKAAGMAKRVVVLKVSGAFHTPLFNGARRKMHTRLQDVDFATPQVPVISNTTQQPFEPATIRQVLERQLAVPTHFGADLQKLVTDCQVRATLEIGPGKTLTRFAKQADRDLATYHIATLDDYQQFVEEYQNGKAQG